MSEPVITDFELPATGNATFKLSDHRGKNVVAYFYPKDNTSGCTRHPRSDEFPKELANRLSR